MYKKYDIKEIRFLPMGENEFETIEEAREFLRYRLPKSKMVSIGIRRRVLTLKMKS